MNRSHRTTQTVLAGVERMAGQALSEVSGRYREESIDPLLAAINGADTTAQLQRALGTGLLKSMKPDALAEALAQTGTQAALLGRAAATPRAEETERKPRSKP